MSQSQKKIYGKVADAIIYFSKIKDDGILSINGRFISILNPEMLFQISKHG